MLFEGKMEELRFIVRDTDLAFVTSVTYVGFLKSDCSSQCDEDWF